MVGTTRKKMSGNWKEDMKNIIEFVAELKKQNKKGKKKDCRERKHAASTFGKEAAAMGRNVDSGMLAVVMQVAMRSTGLAFNNKKKIRLAFNNKKKIGNQNLKLWNKTEHARTTYNISTSIREADVGVMYHRKLDVSLSPTNNFMLGCNDKGHGGFLSPSLGSGRLPASMPPHSTSYVVMPLLNTSVIVVPLCEAKPVSPGVQRVPEKAAGNEAACSGHPSKTVPDAMLQSGQPLLAHKYPGKFNFSVVSSSKNPSNFLEKVNTFFVQTQTNFAVEMNVSFPEVTAAVSVPPGLCVKVMVCYSNPTHLSELGPIVPCSCDTHTATRKPIYGNRFIVSNSKTALYSETKDGHKTLSVKLEDMQTAMSGKYCAVYSYASYTSCLPKNKKIATIFSLMDGEVEVGRDLFYCCVCACPSRDLEIMRKKAPESAGGQPAGKRKRKRKDTSDSSAPSLALSPTTPAPAAGSSGPPVPQVNPSSPSPPEPAPQDPDIDKDGYYTFTWRQKDKVVYDHLCSIKRNCITLQRRFCPACAMSPHA